MNSKLKSSLETAMQDWLNKNADEIGFELEIWQDMGPIGQNAMLMTQAAESVLDAMALQARLEKKMNG
jgi:hypothetical protein